MNTRTRALLVGMILIFSLSLTGLASAGQYWFDPEIPGTNLHVWAPEGAGVDISTNLHDDGSVNYHVTVSFDACVGTYEAGINTSVTNPGDWLASATADCGKKIKFNGKYAP